MQPSVNWEEGDMSESDCLQPEEPELFSIGHSTQSLEDLVALLQQHRNRGRR